MVMGECLCYRDWVQKMRSLCRCGDYGEGGQYGQANMCFVCIFCGNEEMIFSKNDEVGLVAFPTKDADIAVLAIAIDIRPKRLIHTRAGGQVYVQDIVLMNKIFETVVLTMWEAFMDRECIFLSNTITKKPVLVGNHLKVSSFNGLSLSTKTNSCFFIDYPFDEVTEFKSWIAENLDELNEIALMKPYLALTPSNLSLPSEDKYTEIRDIQPLLILHKYFWVKATADVEMKKNSFWFCKSQNSIAVPRARVDVRLHDSTGSLSASAMGETAENILQCRAEETAQNLGEIIRAKIDKDHAFYVKAILLQPNPTEFSPTVQKQQSSADHNEVVSYMG
ncbi:unnamed protein product [Fraxinus pennsylvanica]|uniref:Replication protein A OB domain-containing protein n=1 Tax=Fraxinus pennsylvanica TaxID=56036 RepID=A0AAD1YR02_9LAMI|nr:unnamed protein product [Fraxinus pennsylvanica]